MVVDGEEVGAIGRGLLVLLGAGEGDTTADLDYLVDKTVNLRIFPDESGQSSKMNRSVLDIDGGVLAISQFTLYGDCRKGRRPSFIKALEPTAASALYERFLAGLAGAGVAEVARGVFAADMKVSLVNDGPVTLVLDSRKQF